MDRTLLRGARVLLPDGGLEAADVLLEGGVIAAVGRGLEASDGEVVDVADMTVAPGFIDLHVHGGGGFSLATRDVEEIRAYCRWAVSRGVTGFLATVCARDAPEAMEFLRAAAIAASEHTEGARMLGVNLEGPFVSKSRLGALPESWARPPDVALLEGLLAAGNGHVRMITVAPELEGAERVIEAAASRGVVVSAGHTDASYEAALRGFEAGASHVTHAFNAMRPWHHRDPGPLGAALEQPGVTVEVIADGVHLHPATVQLLARAFGPGRLALVTDGAPPAGTGRGTFRIGGREAQVEAGRAQLSDGTIAGSVATMDEVVRNAVSWAAADMGNVLRMASEVPARALRQEERGRIDEGCAADLVVLDGAMEVAMTFVAGRRAYTRSG
jgi:N-acetylglucosamine-6-phosphate deacetylase